MAFDPTQQAWPGGPHPGEIAAYLRQQEWDGLTADERYERRLRYQRQKEEEQRKHEEAVRRAQPGIIARAAAQEKFMRLIEALKAAGSPGLQRRWQRNGRKKTLFTRQEYWALRELDPPGWPLGRFELWVNLTASTTHMAEFALWALPSGEFVAMYEPGGGVRELSEMHKSSWEWPRMYDSLAAIATKHGVLLPE